MKTLLELRQLMHEIEERYSLRPSQVFELLENGEIMVPLSIFSNRRLGIMECLVKYMRENMGMRIAEIARALGRDNRVLWTTYDHARKKDFYRFSPEAGYRVPAGIFADNSRGPLESLVRYCLEQLGLSYAETAKILGRDQRNIWSVANR